MSRTVSRGELLQACIQDLHAARILAAERLPCLAREAGEALAAQLEDLGHILADESRRLENLGLDLKGPANLWMSGIFDDAERDTRSIMRGPLLDTALIGAVRKGVAADAVSLETAVAVAHSLGNGAAAVLAQGMRDRCRLSDDALRELLGRVVRSRSA